MSADVILAEPQIYELEKVDNKCPNCGFDAPESILICWKCGERLKK